MDSSPSKLNVKPTSSSMAGVKRPAPSLLPAFEPLSSSPVFPRPSKRRAQESPSQREAAYQKYPTPIPTSTTGILSSSPPAVHARATRPRIHRTQSSISERAPLSALATVNLPENGDALLMGRSSNSSHYQLSANRLISRVHVKARYIAATVPLEPNKVEIICSGWNGIKLHCQGRTWELAKGDSFTSETEYAEIMLDVQDARVLIAWPGRDRKESVGAKSESSWDDDNSPRGRASAVSALGQVIESSPLRRGQRIESPVSPTPAGPSNSQTSFSKLFSDDVVPVVKVFEDENSSEAEQEIAQGASMISTEAASSFEAVPVESQSSDHSEPEDEQDPDEENDPIVHSFGPFGANISSRMASFTTRSPELPRGRTLHGPTASPATRSSSEATNQAESSNIINHVVNQLAFSRLSSTPLSVILNQLPESLKNSSPTDVENRGLTKEELQKLLNATSCIGEIHREGKDAAGKRLESEYYYIPDEDTDGNRRAAVVDGLRKPSLRNCRKQHKQYYWKKPKTP
ncbi:Plasmid maintenance 2 [Hyphodiscus hymeniophilus]|uniref:Plasmid maintenance 2 n=1 Tax=Hyphodiscus hymeniophilus TaxID=353542 RepID=A0A9P7AXU5_9HELO|nr:Plasmid maintenance 2 [Hyphodiscus hymeniophilus]